MIFCFEADQLFLPWQRLRFAILFLTLFGGRLHLKEVAVVPSLAAQQHKSHKIIVLLFNKLSSKLITAKQQNLSSSRDPTSNYQSSEGFFGPASQTTENFYYNRESAVATSRRRREEATTVLQRLQSIVCTGLAKATSKLTEELEQQTSLRLKLQGA